MKRRTLLLHLPALCGVLRAQRREQDPFLDAMASELSRSMQLRIAGELPYYIAYRLDDGFNMTCQASLGGLLQTSVTPYRVPRVEVRVGSYEFDNTNAVFTGQIRSTRLDNARWPIEFHPDQARQDLWLATDRAYKNAVQEITLKKSALQNITRSERLNDFAKQGPVVKLLPAAKYKSEERRWNDLARRISAVFTGFPTILDSVVEIQESVSTYYFVNTEGSRIRIPENVASVKIQAQAFADDGSVIRNQRYFHGFELASLPAEAVIRKAAEDLGRSLTAMISAPLGEAYTGPVLFERTAAAQLFAQLFGYQLQATRDPVSQPGRPINLPTGDLEGRLNGRVLPESFTVVDDPNALWNGRKLFGCGEIDEEGTAPQKVTLVEKGVLKSLLYTRQPVRGHEGSTGHARLPGMFGAGTVVPYNLLVTCTDAVAPADLKKKLLELVEQRRKPYGIVVRTLDFPSGAQGGELRRLAASIQSGGNAKPFSIPLEIFRVYPDGREEPVRGLRFRGVTARLLRDILAAGNDAEPFEYLHNTAPMSLAAAGGYVVGVSVICPSLLFDEVELERPQEERPRPPVVPPPPFQTGA